MELFFLPPQSLRRKAARFHANGVWGGSGGRGGGGECGAAAVGSPTARPAQQEGAYAGKQEAMSSDPAGGFEDGGSAPARRAKQVVAYADKQEAMRSDPAGGFEHGQGAVDEAERGSGLGQRGQCGAQRWGLSEKAANPELAALVRHRRRRGCSGALDRLPVEQAGDEEYRNHHQTAAQIGQDELGQQGYRTQAGLA